LAIGFAGAAVPAAAASASDASAVMATVHQFVDGFNKGDAKSALAACDATETDIIDEFPPHHWESCAKWADAYAVAAKAAGDTDGSVTLGKPWNVDVTGNAGYVVVPATYTYKENGKKMTESGSVMTFALAKSSSGWHIRSWTWSKNKLS
jgi:hypothetical protein